MRKPLTEFIGTFFLVLVVLLAAAGGHAGAAAPIAIGLTLMVMVYMGGHISGAHYNPAVTLAVLIRGKISVPDAVVYWVVQFLGAIVAALIAFIIDKKTGFAAPAPAYSLVQVYLAEILGTFALALVVLNVATAKGTANNSFYGAAIGLTVCAMAYAMGNVSGGAFNPAVGVGPILFDMVKGEGRQLGSIPLYIIGPCVGAVLAAVVFKVQNTGE